MMAYDTSPSGMSKGAAKAEATMRDARAGSPKGSAGTHSTVRDKPYAGKASIARNATNKPAPARPIARSTVPGPDSAKRGPVKLVPGKSNTYRTARG